MEIILRIPQYGMKSNSLGGYNMSYCGATVPQWLHLSRPFFLGSMSMYMV